MTAVARPTKPQPPDESDHPRRPLRLLVVDDHPAVRAGLRQLLDDQADFEVAAAVATADEALAIAEREPIDVAVVDYQLGGRNGLWVSRKLKRLSPAPRRVDLLRLHRRRARLGRSGGGSRRNLQQGRPRLRALRSDPQGRSGAPTATAGTRVAGRRATPAPGSPGASDLRPAPRRDQDAADRGHAGSPGSGARVAPMVDAAEAGGCGSFAEWTQSAAVEGNRSNGRVLPR